MDILKCIKNNVAACDIEKVFTISEYKEAVTEEVSNAVALRAQCRTKKEFTSEFAARKYQALVLPIDLPNDLLLTKKSDLRVVANGIMNELLAWKFFPRETYRELPRKKNYTDYRRTGFVTSDEVHRVLSSLFPISSQVQLLAYLALRLLLSKNEQYRMPAASFDFNLLQLLSDCYLEGEYIQRIITRRCGLCGNLYVDSFHQIRAHTTFGYDPYCHACAGYGGSEWANLESKPADFFENTDDLELLKSYANAIQTVPMKDTMRSVLASPCSVGPIFDAWVRLPSYRYYSDKYGDFRIPLIKIGLLPEQVLSGKYGHFCVAKDGHKCRSLAELRIDNFLFENGIQHDVEPLYPYHARYNKSGRRRADWKIGDVYVEYWGLPEDAQYKKKLHDKQNLCEELGITLVEINQYDLIDTVTLVKRIKELCQ